VTIHLRRGKPIAPYYERLSRNHRTTYRHRQLTTYSNHCRLAQTISNGLDPTLTNLMVNNTTSASADLSLTAYHRAMEISCHRRTRILRAKRLATRAMRQSGTSMALVATVKTGYTTNVHGQDRSIRRTCQNTLHDMEHLQYSLNSIEWRPCQQHSNQTVRPWLHRHPS
jgi:hypothetical protein